MTLGVTQGARPFSNCCRTVHQTQPLGISYTKEVRVQDLAAFLEAPWEGNGDREVGRVAPVEDAGAADLSFVSKGKAMAHAATSGAGCLLVPEDFDNTTQRTVIRVKHPRMAVAMAIGRLYPDRKSTRLNSSH